MLSVIAAHDKTLGIGIDNSLPWKCKKDLSRFKELTMDKIIIMGWNTFQSLGCKALKDRNNIVITSNMSKRRILIPKYMDKNQGRKLQFIQIDQLMGDKNVENWVNSKDEIFVIGGAITYKNFLPLSKKVYLSVIQNYFMCDSFFPYDMEAQEEDGRFNLTYKEFVKGDEDESHEYRIYIRKSRRDLK